MDSGDETRKKRDCPDGGGSARSDSGEHMGISPDNHCKKLRPQESLETSLSNNKEIKKNTLQNPTRKHDVGVNVEPVDIETALHRLFQREGSEERLSDHTVIFRSGHAGDAPAISDYYRRSLETSRTDANSKTKSVDKPRKSNEGQDSSSSALELWLSEATGDESRPPSIFSILATVSSSRRENKETSRPSKQLGAVALFTLVWRNNQRMLRTEWFHVDKTSPEPRILESRMWLRLSALALMTGACLCVTDDEPIELDGGAGLG